MRWLRGPYRIQPCRNDMGTVYGVRGLCDGCPVSMVYAMFSRYDGTPPILRTPAEMLYKLRAGFDLARRSADGHITDAMDVLYKRRCHTKTIGRPHGAWSVAALEFANAWPRRGPHISHTHVVWLISKGVVIEEPGSTPRSADWLRINLDHLLFIEYEAEQEMLEWEKFRLQENSPPKRVRKKRARVDGIPASHHARDQDGEGLPAGDGGASGRSDSDGFECWRLP